MSREENLRLVLLKCDWLIAIHQLLEYRRIDSSLIRSITSEEDLKIEEYLIYPINEALPQVDKSTYEEVQSSFQLSSILPASYASRQLGPYEGLGQLTLVEVSKASRIFLPWVP